MAKKNITDRSLVSFPANYKKSNILVGAKYKSTLIENKLLTLSLSKANDMIAEEVYIDGQKTKVFTSVMKSSEIMNAMGLTRKNISSQLSAAYLKMQSRQIGIEDENGQFAYRNLFIGADYVNGEFKLYYNPLLGNFYKEVSKNYTWYSLETMMNFKSVHSFRLYELLKKECYDMNKNAKVFKEGEQKKYLFTYSVSELKLMLGVINADSQAVRNVLNTRKGAPDYDKAVEASPEKGFARWNDFSRRCIIPAIKEINDNTELFVTYSLEKSGQGGKVHSVTFDVMLKEQIEVIDMKTVFTENDKLAFIDDIFDVIEEKIKVKDAQALAEASKYDIEAIKKAYNIAKSAKNVDNLIGFMIKAIVEQWDEPTSLTKSKTKCNSFGAFPQNDINFIELEKKLYAN